MRLGQADFSAAVLRNYGHRCCFPGCAVTDRRFLVGSHIARWADAEHMRGSVANGLCLCLTHDRAFELGLFTLDEGFRVTIPTAGACEFGSTYVEPFIGKTITLGKIHPADEALLAHWERVGF
jgi:putative restriction endonuclease